MAGIKMSERAWRFGDHGCCGDGGFTSKGDPKPCGCRTLVVDIEAMPDKRITWDKKEGPEPRKWPVFCDRCHAPYTLYPHTNRVEVRQSV